MKSWSRDPESRLIQNYINPLWLTKKTFVTAKMQATHQRGFLHKLRVLLVFIEFNNLICILMRRQRRTHPAPSPALQPPPQPAPTRKKSQQTYGSCPRSFKDKKEDATATSWPTSYTQISQDTRILAGSHLTSSRNAHSTTLRSQSPILGSH